MVDMRRIIALVVAIALVVDPGLPQISARLGFQESSTIAFQIEALANRSRQTPQPQVARSLTRKISASQIVETGALMGRRSVVAGAIGVWMAQARPAQDE